MGFEPESVHVQRNISKISQPGFVSQQDLCYKSDYLHNEGGRQRKVELIFFMDFFPFYLYLKFFLALPCSALTVSSSGLFAHFQCPPQDQL